MPIVRRKKKIKKPIPVKPEYQWLDQQNSAGSPSNPMGIPSGLSGISECPERTIAEKWVLNNCKFALKS